MKLKHFHRAYRHVHRHHKKYLLGGLIGVGGFFAVKAFILLFASFFSIHYASNNPTFADDCSTIPEQSICDAQEFCQWNTTGSVCEAKAPINQTPIAHDGSGSTVIDTPFSATLSATDPESGVLTYFTGSNPSFGELNLSTDGTFTYTPTI